MNTLLILAVLGAVRQTPTIDSYLQTGLNDATMVARLNGNQVELRKINEDFGQSYKFDTTTMRYKEPLKMRLDATVEDTTITYILNGPILDIKIPRAHIASRQDLTGKPGRRQTPLDIGLLTPSVFQSMFTATFVRMARATGDPVFDLLYQERQDRSRQRIWVDPDKHIVAKREWYNQWGRQLATFYYEDPKQIDGIWMPTQMTVKNVDDKVAGVTHYISLKVNTGLPDSIFATDR